MKVTESLLKLLLVAITKGTYRAHARAHFTFLEKNMGSITQNSSGKYVVRVKKKDPRSGVEIRKSHTFSTKREATKWCRDTEHEIEAGHYEEKRHAGKTFSELLDTYRDRVSITKESAHWEIKKISFIKILPIAKRVLSSIQRDDITEWRDDRLKTVSGESLRREWTVMNSVFNYGINDLGWISTNPMTTVKKPPKGAPRAAIFTNEDLDKAIYVSGYQPDSPPHTKIAKVCAALLLGVETAIRSKEMSLMTWDMVKEDRIELPGKMTINGKESFITKTGIPRVVPLSKRAKIIISQFREIQDGDSVLNITSTDMTNHFRKIRQKASLDGLTFRDSRATALTRLSKVFENPMELAKISGHMDLSILLNTYYRPTADSLVEKMAKA